MRSEVRLYRIILGDGPMRGGVAWIDPYSVVFPAGYEGGEYVCYMDSGATVGTWGTTFPVWTVNGEDISRQDLIDLAISLGESEPTHRGYKPQLDQDGYYDSSGEWWQDAHHYVPSDTDEVLKLIDETLS